ncbi:hypothetical protein [Streptomyces sp. BK340]|uniref:hypothetical protein n=1 Tax=Streptomyces sp. BK340 TaxID=2572903 RepID=UPI0011A3DDC6|nr:hypothetical protein [Streptomyces sp. BK340]
MALISAIPHVRQRLLERLAAVPGAAAHDGAALHRLRGRGVRGLRVAEVRSPGAVSPRHLSGARRFPAYRRLHRRRPPGRLTEGDRPDDWPLVFWPRHADQGPPLEQGLIDTLPAWQRGRHGTAGLCVLDEDDDPAEFADFETFDEEEDD